MARTAEIAGVLQGLLTGTAEEIGDECQLIRRKREFTASSLLSTIVLGFLRWTNPKWEQLASLARQFGVECLSAGHRAAIHGGVARQFEGAVAGCDEVAGRLGHGLGTTEPDGRRAGPDQRLDEPATRGPAACGFAVSLRLGIFQSAPTSSVESRRSTLDHARDFGHPRLGRWAIDQPV